MSTQMMIDRELLPTCLNWPYGCDDLNAVTVGEIDLLWIDDDGPSGTQIVLCWECNNCGQKFRAPAGDQMSYNPEILN